ncbi:hypothetical protein [Pandoraea pnomenusa]|uniref:hypothetical protein n=1 Tax=Pandoraea pnomenusa TaxID=93220 RepID=UPI001AC21A9A|nr:hypothetical protein [Pandoraea pnomenusa]MBN9095441.1 hypothetical protein [Pandoraea pnomenusa]
MTDLLICRTTERSSRHNGRDTSNSQQGFHLATAILARQLSTLTGPAHGEAFRHLTTLTVSRRHLRRHTHRTFHPTARRFIMTSKSMTLLRTDTAPARLSSPVSREEGKNYHPNVAVIDPTILADRPADFPADAPPYNLVKASAVGPEIRFEAAFLDQMTVGWKYVVYFDGDTDDVIRVVTAEDHAKRSITITLPPEQASMEDVHNLQYVARSELEDEWSFLSPPSLFTIDTQRPGEPRPGELEFPDGIEQDGLTDAKLTELGDVLRGIVESYAERMHGDTLVGILRREDGTEVGRLPPHQIPYGETYDPPTELVFPRTLIEQAGDGKLRFSYEITDLAGNVSAESDVVVIDVFLRPGIADLMPPLVPAYDDDPPPDAKLIDEADARAPVEVEIPGHAEIETGDEIAVLWGGREQNRVVFNGADSTLPVILSIRVPYGEVLAEWADAPPDADGYARVPVSYIVYRAGREAGRPKTPHSVVVNLDQGGGVDPDPDTPWNDALGRPVVHHSGWSTGEREDFIPDASIQEDHEFIVPWFRRDIDGNITGEDAFIAGDIIYAVYDGVTIEPRYTVGGDDVSQKVDLVISLPWAVVKAQGSGLKPTVYLVTRYLNPEQRENTSVSPTAEVEVADSGDIPGGDDGLFPATFPNGKVIWSNVSPIGHEPIEVPAYENMRLGDVIRIFVTADFYDPVDQTYGAPITRAYFGGDNGENPHPDYRFEISLAQENIGEPVRFGWPKELIEWGYPYGMCRIDYTVTRADGSHKTSASTGAETRLDTSANYPGPYPFGVRQTHVTLSETMALAKTTPDKRQSILNAFVRQWLMSAAQRRSYRQREKQALALAMKQR